MKCLILQADFSTNKPEKKTKKTLPHCTTYFDKAHLAHGLLVVVVHLADEGVAEMHSDALDGLILPGRLQDLKQQHIDPVVLEL